MNKIEIRKNLRSARAEVDRSEWQLLCDHIQLNCIDLLRSLTVQSVFIYLESQKSREVSTSAIIEFCHSQSTGIYVPKTFDDGSMEPVSLESGSKLVVNKWGILEPSGGSFQTGINLNVAVVPLLGCDLNGNRLGYGKGYYDRFLQRFPNIISIGLCPEFALLKSVPAEQHDVPLKYVVTERRVIRI